MKEELALILLYSILLIAGLGFIYFGIKTWRKNSVRENFWDSLLSLFLGVFGSSALGMLLFGLSLVFLSLMKFIYGFNWGIE